MSSELSMEGLEAHRDYIAGAMRERTNSAAAESLGILHSMAESWRAHVEATADIPVATNDDLRWADGLALGTPTRFGNVSAQMKQFLDSAGPLWMAGELPGRTATAFTSTGTLHGGAEATILSLYQTMFHWGSIMVAPGYTQPDVAGGGQAPYGVAHTAGSGLPDEAVLAAAKHQGFRLGTYTERLVTSA